MALLAWYHHRCTTHWTMTTIALVYPYTFITPACPLRYWIQSRGQCLTFMRVAQKSSAPYDYMTSRPTRDGDFAAQRLLLRRLLLGYTAYCWFMEAVPLALISSLLAHHTLHD
jgi:hypothetical protein